MLNILRELMKKNNVDAYIIPTSDPHGSEYIADFYKEREFITKFTGSAGTAVVTNESAKLWADGRYFIQAENQIKGTGFDLIKMGLSNSVSVEDYIKENLTKGSKVAINGLYFSQSSFESLKDRLGESIDIVDIDLIKDIFLDRPALPNGNVFLHDIKYAGKSIEEKLNLIKKNLEQRNCDSILITSLEDICWILNIRGSDIKNTPVVMSYLLICKDETILFIDKSKLDSNVTDYLNKNLIIKEYDEIFTYLKNLSDKKFYLDKKRVNHTLYDLVCNKNQIVAGEDFVSLFKTIKNDVEIANQKFCYLKDGVALTKFIYWLKNIADIDNLTEYDVSEKLMEFRKQQDLYIEDSFDTIAAYGLNAAMMHYSASKGNAAKLNKKGFLLVDSGGQYLDGTTDITRTITLGDITEEERFDFTLTLKSHLALLSAKFLEGTILSTLDGIARYIIQRENYDYKCSTGHGVGYLSCVHELPPLISQKSNNSTIHQGMIVSNEPGVYRDGKYGIRIENIMLCVDDIVNESGKFLKFETLSLAPIDLDAIDVNLLDVFEIKSLNNYHKMVYDKLSVYMTEEEKVWLKEATKEIGD